MINQTIVNQKNGTLLFDSIASLLKSRREANGISKSELARRLNTSPAIIKRWETPGYTGYSLSKLLEIASVLGCGVELIFTFTLEQK